MVPSKISHPLTLLTPMAYGGRIANLVGNTYLLPNPNEYYPTVGEFVGIESPVSKLHTSKTHLVSVANRVSGEKVVTPAMYVGNYPVMAGDDSTIVWENSCTRS